MNLDKRLLRLATGARFHLVLTIAAGLLAGVVLVGQARYLSLIVNRVFLGGNSLGQVRPFLFTLLWLSLVRAGLAWTGEVAANRVAGRIKADLRQRLLSHLLNLGPAYAHAERSGELTNTLVEGIEALDAYFSQYLPQLALAALVPLTVLIFVFPLDLLSGLVLLLTAPLIPVFMILIGNLAEALTRRQWTALSRMSAHFLDVLQGLTTLKLLGRSQDQIRTITHISDRFRRTTLGVLRIAFQSALVMELVATISTAVVAVQIGLRLLYGHVGFEEAFFILILAPEFYLPLRQLGVRYHAATSGLAAAQRIFEVLDEAKLDEKAETRVLDGAVSHRPAKPGPGRSIRFDNVHYAYEDGRRPALLGLSFELSPGQNVALVGPSGAGKSTVAYLLLRFIEPDRGHITVGDMPLRELPVRAWRSQVAWVPQDPYLFHTTVAENIGMARPDASRDEIIWAARQAYAHDFIQALPQGYDTPVGERGARLSGGQTQRIALARAFLKDAHLLILDEPTAHLDPEHTACLTQAIARLVQDRTVLTIAHRLSTVFQADRILVMDGGRLVENGSHASLLQEGRLYPRLVTAYQSSPTGSERRGAL
jgi:thiol reductant ABC exporter CydD subunit